MESDKWSRVYLGSLFSAWSDVPLQQQVLIGSKQNEEKFSVGWNKVQCARIPSCFWVVNCNIKEVYLIYSFEVCQFKVERFMYVYVRVCVCII
jgi:hypothetical protein